MAIFVAVLIVAGAYRKLHPTRMRETASVRWIRMPVLAAFLQLVLFIPAVRELTANTKLIVVLASYGIVGIWLIANTVQQQPRLRLCGALITLGWLSNVIAIVANRGMPVSRAALLRLGVRHPSVSNGNLFKHVIATSHSVVPWLGDFIPITIPVLRNVISIGDILVVLGVAIAIQRVEFRPGSLFGPAALHAPKDAVLQLPHVP